MRPCAVKGLRTEVCCDVQVWLATCKGTAEQVAVKILELDNMACDLVSNADRFKTCSNVQFARRSEHIAPAHSSLDARQS